MIISAEASLFIQVQGFKERKMPSEMDVAPLYYILYTTMLHPSEMIFFFPLLKVDGRNGNEIYLFF